MAENTATPASAPQRPQTAAPVPLPYVPTDAEQAYMQVCAEAIVKGCDAAQSAAAAGNGGEYLQFANGVKSLTQAYEEIRTGGKVSTGHQGS